MTDDKLFRAIKDAAAEIGWHDKAGILQRAHLRILREAEKLPSGLYDRLSRVWEDRIETTEPN